MKIITDLDVFKTFIFYNIGRVYQQTVNYFGDTVVTKMFSRNGDRYCLLGRFAQNGGHVSTILQKNGKCIVDGRSFDLGFVLGLIKEAL